MSSKTHDSSWRGVSARVIPFVFFSFLCYLTIGVQLAILPSFVHLRLGYSTVLAGLVISAEYIATVVSRPWSGWVVDRLGAKKGVVYGLAMTGASGVLTLAAAFLIHTPWLGLAVLLAGRLVLGGAESLVTTGATIWGILTVGAENTATVISWNGISTYGGLAIGAPLGVALESGLGFWAIGAFVLLGGFGALAIAMRRAPVPVVHGEKQPFHHVLGRVAPFGLGLALGSVGFGVLATFITLDFASRHWTGAAFALSAFGGSFVCARLVFSRLINRLGGFRVGMACFAVESLGLATLWLAHARPVAFLGAALTGFGFSLVFPSLGVEAVRPVAPQDRGTALGAYGVFMDFSLMAVGPGAGAVIAGYGYPAIYLCAMVSVLAALGLTGILAARAGRVG